MSAFEAALHAYTRVPPEVLHRCEFRLSTATWKMLRDEAIAAAVRGGLRSAVGREEKPSPDDSLFDRPIRIDETLAPGVVEAWQKISG